MLWRFNSIFNSWLDFVVYFLVESIYFSFRYSINQSVAMLLLFLASYSTFQSVNRSDGTIRLVLWMIFFSWWHSCHSCRRDDDISSFFDDYYLSLFRLILPLIQPPTFLLLTTLRRPSYCSWFDSNSLLLSLLLAYEGSCVAVLDK